MLGVAIWLHMVGANGTEDEPEGCNTATFVWSMGRKHR